MGNCLKPATGRHDAARSRYTQPATDSPRSGGSEGSASTSRARAGHSQLAGLPERPAIMRWPDGRAASGTVAGGQDGGLTFQPDANSGGPLEDRRVKADARALIPVGMPPRRLNVLPMRHNAQGSDLVLVEPRLLSDGMSLRQDVLAAMARVAGSALDTFTAFHGNAVGQPPGLHRAYAETFCCVLQGVLKQLESRCDDPQKVRAAWRALEKGQPFEFEISVDARSGICRSMMQVAEELLQPDVGTDRHSASRSASSTESDSDTEIRQPDHLRELLFGLQDGENVYVSGRQSMQSGGHRMGILLSRENRKVARIGIVNSNGWSHCLGEGGSKSPQILSRPMAIENAVVMLKLLGRGDSIKPREEVPAAAWRNAAFGAALFSWLAIPGVRFKRGPLIPPQKGSDCTPESYFACLGALLTPADYKLVKANTLNVLAQAAREQNESAEVQERLAQRITSALSGHVVRPR